MILADDDAVFLCFSEPIFLLFIHFLPKFLQHFVLLYALLLQVLDLQRFLSHVYFHALNLRQLFHHFHDFVFTVKISEIRHYF